ncbi:hypothetical protein [Sphaerisporangium aureirubrum]|uniref:hypothetical protein n=1 Tax=Sphaerisporangium aureirubrum TaxID=1544736 RepID=UPI0036D2AE69
MAKPRRRLCPVQRPSSLAAVAMRVTTSELIRPSGSPIRRPPRVSGGLMRPRRSMRTSSGPEVRPASASVATRARTARTGQVAGLAP